MQATNNKPNVILMFVNYKHFLSETCYLPVALNFTADFADYRVIRLLTIIERLIHPLSVKI
jgi:hypothetical protein